MRRFIASFKNQQNSTVIAALVLLVFSFLFGGASRLNDLRVALVELAALPLLVLVASQALRGAFPEHNRSVLWLVAAVVAVPLLQLIPLPPGIWTDLPGREPLNQALDLSGASVGWLPLSLTPEQTWRSALALIPPVAMFLAVLSMPRKSHGLLIYTALSLTAAGILLGAAQLASGGTQLYLWPTTDVGSVVGFLANRNHFATLCLICLPFATAAAAGALRSNDRLKVWLFAVMAAVLVAMLVIIRSRTGLLLLVPVMLVSALMVWRTFARRFPPVFVAISAVTLGGILVMGLIALEPALKRFEAGGSHESRFEKWPIIAEAANTYLPVGSGVGSFDTVYRSVEPLELLTPTFFNQAHNDYLETWLETGWFGAFALLAFFIWYGATSFAAWRAVPSANRDLSRAASIAIGVVLVHSFVDYPIRTETIAVLFAICCGILQFSRRDAAAQDR